MTHLLFLSRVLGTRALPAAAVALLGSIPMPASPRTVETFDKTSAYCLSSAIFVGQARKVYFNDKPDMDTCDEPVPTTAMQFASQLMTCYPLMVELDVKEYVFSTEAKPRARFRLHMKWVPPEWAAHTMKTMADRMLKTPRIYSVRFIEVYEQDGKTWLMGYPRDTAELGYLRSQSGMPPCSPQGK